MRHWFQGTGALRTAVVAVLAATLSGAAPSSSAGVREAGPDQLAKTKSLGALVAEATPDKPIHIIFVHGIRANGRGTASQFVTNLCEEMKSICQGVTGPAAGAPKRLDIGDYPKDAQHVERRIWATQKEWDASRPFVDRYQLALSGGRRIVVDEVNWWPLLFPLKCRFLVEEDRNLSGKDKKRDQICRNIDSAKDPSRYDWLENYRPAPGTAAKGQYFGNRALKQEILNWGLSDAVVALGPVRAYTRLAMQASFQEAAQVDGKAPEDQTLVLVTESLGSFVVMDALRHAPPASALTEVVGRSDYLYFFANQFALLELGRIGGVEPSIEAGEPEPSALIGARREGPASAAPQDAKSLLQNWADQAQPSLRSERQIIAFSDPNDALTFLVPPLDGVTVVNVQVKNGGWFIPFLLTDPAAAHTGHSRNKAVLRQMLTNVK